ncbi:MAG: DHH family phosphoesterase [Lachnospiraceae bacterium]|nr:DHH family phosphoesterase [Lachnospiraceae bacterium]
MKKNTIKLKGRLKHYTRSLIYLGIVLVLINIAIYFLNTEAGFLLSAFLVVYFVVTLATSLNNRPLLMNELISFATQYGQIQKQLLYDLDLPHALLDENGKILWTNALFEETVGQDHDYHKSITSVFPSITKDKLPGHMVLQGAGEDGEDLIADHCEVDLSFDDHEYVTKMRRISLEEMAKASDIIDEDEYEGYLIALYMFDVTALKIALREVDDQSVSVGLIYLDNYDEALASVEEVRRALLIALIDRKVNKYISAMDGICKKLEKDKYLVIMRKKSVGVLQENKFDLLEDVKTVNIGNEMAVTISVGFGLDGLTYSQNYEFARNAIDLALGRGGDQAVVKTPKQVVYYGGKSQQVEKSTRVKARVKAQALQEIISGKDMVIAMGHRLGDADSFGSAVGIYRMAKAMDKEAHIVINTITNSMEPMVDLFRNNEQYESDMIIDSAKALSMVNSNTVLVVVDVDKPSITECPDLIKLCNSVVVLDHHRQGSETIENATLSYIEPYASSACEMVSEILQYASGNIKITPEEADCMYSGIMVDTNNFMNKTGVRTFEAAAYLRRSGADVTRVRKMFREDASEYKAKADAVSQAEIYRNSYAISFCSTEDVKSPTVIGAQAANELLNIKGVKASFVMTDYQDTIYVSARSIDEVNVQIIMERLGGGGHLNVAGCQMEGKSIAEAIVIIKDTLDKMIEEGAI